MTQHSIFIRLSLLMAAMVMLSGCSNDDAQTEEKSDKTVHLTSRIQTTRSTEDLQSTQINSGVTVGVFGLSGENTITNGDNASYIVEGSGNLQASTSTMSWPESGSLTIYAYAPYQESWNDVSTTKTFMVAADQSTDEGYLASDLLYASASASSYSTINMSFAHKLARLIITLNTNSALSKATVKVMNTKPAATFTLTDGSIGEATGDATTITVGSNIALSANGSTTLYAVIIPQTIPANTTLVEVTDGMETWKYNFSTATTFESGKSYTFTINAGTTTVAATTSGTATTPAMSPQK